MGSSVIRLEKDFIWASGIEDTFVPQTRAGHRALDEYELMGHYEHWREDLKLAAHVGLDALRWGVPWYRVEPRRGEFEWHWTDEVIPYLVLDLGVQPIVDLMHFGCPYWLDRGFANPEYPRAVASYAAAFAERYRGLVKWYTPLNEPLMTALMCGRRGAWPPYLRGDPGYVCVLMAVVKGILETVHAIKAIDSGAVMVHVEATGMSMTARQDLAGVVEDERARHFLALDLTTGQVDASHPLFVWLVRNGASIHDLDYIREHRIGLDVVGLNFYPQWSTHELTLDRKGKLAYRRADTKGTGFAALIRAYHSRYGAPIMITETSAAGDDSVRLDWLRTSIHTVRSLRAEGVPVIGYTWFPLFTMIDWRYRHGRSPLSTYRIELGLFCLEETGSPRWRATQLVDGFKGFMSEPDGFQGSTAGALP